jgi:hypothetical protein
MKKKIKKEVIPEVARLRKVNSYKLSCRERTPYNEDSRYTRYIFAETKEDAIEKLKNWKNFRKETELLQILPEIVSENSSILKITNTSFENLMSRTFLDSEDLLETDSFKLMQPKMKEFKFNFIATKTIIDEYTSEIVSETKEDAIKKLKENFYNCDLTDIKEVIVDKELEVA